MTRFARMRPLVLLLAALSPLGPAWSQGLPSASNATTAAMMTAGTTNLTVTSAPVTHAAVLLTGSVT